MGINDFHTHNLLADHAIINVPQAWVLNVNAFAPRKGAVYSAGIHPWWTVDEHETQLMLQQLPTLLAHPQVIAVGECGLDVLQGAKVEEQERIFKAQIQLAEQFQLPVTLHIVRAYDRLLHLHKQLRPTTPWTVHGFRGKPALAQQLLKAGLNLSFGKHFNQASWDITPPSRRFTETDEL